MRRLHQGRVLARRSKAEVFTPDNIQAAFRLKPVVHTSADGAMHLVFT